MIIPPLVPLQTAPVPAQPPPTVRHFRQPVGNVQQLAVDLRGASAGMVGFWILQHRCQIAFLRFCFFRQLAACCQGDEFHESPIEEIVEGFAEGFFN